MESVYHGECKKEKKKKTTVIIAGKLFDPYTLRLFPNQLITVDNESGLVTDVSDAPGESESVGAGDDPEVDVDMEVIDLSTLTVLPGFVDAHVHFFLHQYTEATWEEQVTKESLTERVVRATVHAKRTLMAGFTAVRDLGTEGADDADIALRKCFSRRGVGKDSTEALIPGPRYFCASRAIVPTGSYGPKSTIHISREGVDGITGADVADGREECIKAVRRQIGAGADWIKIYADSRPRSRMVCVSTDAGRASMSTFNRDELQALIDTAHQYGVKVAAHATNKETIALLLTLGVDTIEHGYDIVSSGDPRKPSDDPRADDDGRVTLRALAKSKTILVPTLGAFYTMSHGPGDTDAWDRASRSFRAALEEGVENLACGGDTGVFAHGRNALEMSLMVRLGADWRKVLRWGTLGGWECIRSMDWEGPKGEARLACVEDLGESVNVVGENEVPFGAVKRGFAADMIATSGDFETDFEGAVSAESVLFVMKGGRVYKRDGVSVV